MGKFMKTIYAVLGKKCGHTHYYAVELDVTRSLYSMLQTPEEPILKFKEVEFKEAGGRKFDMIIVDELAEPKKRKKS